MSYLKQFSKKSRACGLIAAALIPLAAYGQVEGAPTSSQTQEVATQSGNNNVSEDRNTPAPAFGAGANIVPSATENPPISALDQPSLELGGVSRSFLSPGLILSQSGNSNIPGNFGSIKTSDAGGATRAMGSVILQRLWGRYETDLQYVGGGIFYEGVNRDPTQIHDAEAAQRVIWRTGQLVLRDSVSYLPEGNFGAGSFGGSGAFHAGLAGLESGANNLSSGSAGAMGGSFSAGQFGSVGQAPRLTNSAVVDVVEALNPRSSITAAGSYGFVHFTDTSVGLIDSDQFSAQLGYDRQLTRADQVAVSYGYQDINFPRVGGSSVDVNTIQLSYGHRISGRLDFVTGGGPQFIQIHNSLFGSSSRISGTGNVRLRYRFSSRTSMQAQYRHFETNGSGYFLGATTDAGNFSATRALGRVWEANADIGVARNGRLVGVSAIGAATSDSYLFAGAAAHRHLGRRFRLFLSYQYDRFAFNTSVCSASGTCGKTSNRQMGAIGIEWYPRPTRLD